MFLMFNTLTIYIFVGRTCDPYFLNSVCKVSDVREVDRQISEEEIFADVESNPYLTVLYNIINQIRA